jgi:hypothetical protein
LALVIAWRRLQWAAVQLPALSSAALTVNVAARSCRAVRSVTAITGKREAGFLSMQRVTTAFADLLSAAVSPSQTRLFP